MATQFHAGFVYMSDEDGVITVGFADREYDTTRYVLLQRDRNATAKERTLGMDDVHFELDDQAHSAYGAIETLRLMRTAVAIVLRPDKAEQCSTDQEVRVDIALDDAQYAALHRCLRALWEQRPGVLLNAP